MAVELPPPPHLKSEDRRDGERMSEEGREGCGKKKE